MRLLIATVRDGSIVSCDLHSVGLLMALVVLGWSAVLVESTDYCNAELCFGTGLRHVGCNHTEKPADVCQKFKLIPMTHERKLMLLDEHNRLRNRIASGSEKYSKNGLLPTAKSMRFLTWDDELAYLAQLNVMSCVMSHDCARTDTFPHAGQNLGSVWSTALDYFQVTEPLLVDIVRRWYDEVLDTELSLLENYHNIDDGIQRGHFTQMVRDEATKIGCSASFYLQPNEQYGHVHVLLMACNYSEGNLLEAPTYEKGTPCSNCHKCNQKYPALCED